MKKVENYKEERPWGSFIEFALNEPVTVKIITVNPNQAFSLQKHQKRSEYWHIISGEGKVIIGEETFDIKSGEDFVVEKETLHQIQAGEKPVILLEVARGEFDENDITRIKDLYGRT